MTMRRDTLAALKGTLARLERGVMPSVLPHFSLGLPELDGALGGGLARASLHEIFAASPAHGPAATGFALALAVCATPSAPMVWVRQRMFDQEFGRPYGHGIAALGFDPGRLVLVRARTAEDVLKVAHEAARCAAVGTVLAEIWGAPKVLDLTASRRLSLAAAASGVTVLATRIDAAPAASAATSRWQVRAAVSQDRQTGLPGLPAFLVTLLRHRAGIPPRDWPMEWDREHRRFQRTALPRRLDALPADRTGASPAEAPWPVQKPLSFRRAG